MKVSVKLEYACRVMVQLARSHHSGQLAHIGELSEAEGIPPNYLAQILTELREANLIVSRRGKQGGYALARSPDRISVLDVAVAVEGDLLELGQPPGGASAVPVREALEELRNVMRARAAAMSIEALLPKSADAMYFI
jgi:Rrf2 family protein